MVIENILDGNMRSIGHGLCDEKNGKETWTLISSYFNMREKIHFG